MTDCRRLLQDTKETAISRVGSASWKCACSHSSLGLVFLVKSLHSCGSATTLHTWHSSPRHLAISPTYVALNRRRFDDIVTVSETKTQHLRSIEKKKFGKRQHDLEQTNTNLWIGRWYSGTCEGSSSIRSTVWGTKKINRQSGRGNKPRQD
jgi:hypothetical protein